MVGELCDLLLLTGLGKERGPSIGTLLAVHGGGATLGIAGGVLLWTGWSIWVAAALAIAAGAIAAAVTRRAVPVLAAVLVELTTCLWMVAMLWVHLQLPG